MSPCSTLLGKEMALSQRRSSKKNKITLKIVCLIGYLILSLKPKVISGAVKMIKSVGCYSSSFTKAVLLLLPSLDAHSMWTEFCVLVILLF